MSRAHPSEALPTGAHGPPQQHQHQPAVQGGLQSSGQGTAEFFLSNYRLGKTLGIGSFGKVSWGLRMLQIGPTNIYHCGDASKCQY
jgi:hypothetical protein